MQGIVPFLFLAHTFEQTALCLFSAAFRTKSRSEQGDIEVCYWTAFVWRRREAGISSSAENLIRTELPMHSLKTTNQTTVGQPCLLFPLILRSENRKIFCSFFFSFLFSLIADRSTSNPRDAITCLFCFTSSLYLPPSATS